jgi:hypothetical protein
MLSFASDFWPLLWATLGIGTALTVLLTILVAAAWPDRTARQGHATVHDLPRARAGQARKAA